MHRFTLLIYFIPTLTNVDIGFFTHTDLAKDFFDVSSLHKDFNCEVVVALVGESVATVVFAGVED